MLVRWVRLQFMSLDSYLPDCGLVRTNPAEREKNLRRFLADARQQVDQCHQKEIVSLCRFLANHRPNSLHFRKQRTLRNSSNTIRLFFTHNTYCYSRSGTLTHRPFSLALYWTNVSLEREIYYHSSQSLYQNHHNGPGAMHPYLVQHDYVCTVVAMFL